MTGCLKKFRNQFLQNSFALQLSIACNTCVWIFPPNAEAHTLVAHKVDGRIYNVGSQNTQASKVSKDCCQKCHLTWFILGDFCCVFMQRTYDSYFSTCFALWILWGWMCWQGESPVPARIDYEAFRKLYRDGALDNRKIQLDIPDGRSRLPLEIGGVNGFGVNELIFRVHVFSYNHSLTMHCVESIKPIA